MDFERPSFGPVCSAWKHAANTKDCTGYEGGGGGKIVLGNVTLANNCNIVFTPGYATGGPSKVAGEETWKVYGYNPVAERTRYVGEFQYLYTGADPGSIKFVDSNTGAVLASNTRQATANFIAGAGEVTPTTETKTFLVQTSGIAAAQNLAFDMDDYDNNDWEA